MAVVVSFMNIADYIQVNILWQHQQSSEWLENNKTYNCFGNTAAISLHYIF